MPRERSMTSRGKGLGASVVMGRGLSTWAAYLPLALGRRGVGADGE